MDDLILSIPIWNREQNLKTILQTAASTPVPTETMGSPQKCSRPY